MWRFLRRQESESGQAASAALEEAQQKLQEVQERTDEVTALSKSFKIFRERNHFGEQLENLILVRRRNS